MSSPRDTVLVPHVMLLTPTYANTTPQDHQSTISTPASHNSRTSTSFSARNTQHHDLPIRRQAGSRTVYA
ncbi:hypothetical protein Hypma_001351 [Hypsizygus marmoreus]|uniref:Uncharacterized protein n=1 Tax=Hypsizygus marmoreus TaxID=39966 RepID=A0A369K8S4_HYPMA|nr:hypothetical protein Hypma_001351 [Hypsizygus marmoreus]